MTKNSINPAIAHMDVAQNEIATYAMLLGKAQLSLTSSMQAFERANENSLTDDCPTGKQMTQKLREQYAALTNLTDAIVGTLAAPTFSRMIATAPQQNTVEVSDRLEEQMLSQADFIDYSVQFANIQRVVLNIPEPWKTELADAASDLQKAIQAELAARILAAGR